MASEAARLNQEFYERVAAGRRDYWRKMAACRHRVGTLVASLAEDGPTTVVDLGCGDGSLIEEIASTLPAASLVGVDISFNQIQLNRRAMPSVDWHVCDLDGDFTLTVRHRADALVASEVIEHLDHPQEFLRSARALASATGKLYLSTQSGPLRETERRVGHRRHFTAGELSGLLKDTGWLPIRVWNTGFPFHDLSKWYANINPDRSMAEFDERPYGFKQNAICWALRQAFRLNSRRRGAQLFAVAAR
jgi:cyclopropane fatty-acyl-phospholipid synthase-like methyltransferase